MKKIKNVSILFIMSIFSIAILVACSTKQHNNTSGDIDGSDTNDRPLETSMEEDNDYTQQIYDYYRTYDEARIDIENGYVINIDYSFSEAAIPTVINNSTVSFYVHDENTLDINVNLENLFSREEQESVVKFEVYDPSGKTAYSFIREGKDIETPTENVDQIQLYPGEWTYNISFSYKSNGLDEAKTIISAKYGTPQEEDIQWLLDHKLNILH